MLAVRYFGLNIYDVCEILARPRKPFGGYSRISDLELDLIELN